VNEPGWCASHYRRPVTPRVVAVAALFVYGWWATGRRPFSSVATVAVVGAGLVAIVWGLRHRRPRRPVTTTRGLGGWAVLAALLAAWQLAAYAQTPRSEHPTLSSIANAVLEPHPLQAVAFVAWLVLAAELAMR
jgi:hypothetical protein